MKAFLEEKASPSLKHPPVVMMEDHDGAYWAWKEQGFGQRILYHFDAHIDFDEIPESAEDLIELASRTKNASPKLAQGYWNLKKAPIDKLVGIANYIGQALREDIVSEFVWIYPDHPDGKQQEKAVREILQGLKRSFGIQGFKAKVGSGGYEGFLEGKPFQAVPYREALKKIPREPVLLDIDTDFFFVQNLASKNYPFGDLNQPDLWMKPENFVRDIQTSQMQYDFVTIAYSVEGGFTPLEIKYTGDELSSVLSGEEPSPSTAYYERLRAASKLRRTGKTSEALSLLENSVAEFPPKPAIFFALALAQMAAGDKSAAKTSYERAVGLEATYRTRYNHAGLAFADKGEWDAADRSYSILETWDPHHPGLLEYEVMKARKDKDYQQIIQCRDSILSREDISTQILLFLAEAYLFLGNSRQATAILTQYAQKEPDIVNIRYWRLKARIAKKEKDTASEMEACQKLLERGVRTAGIHWALAKLYARKKNLYKAKRHFQKAAAYFFRFLCCRGQDTVSKIFERG